MPPRLPFVLLICAASCAPAAEDQPVANGSAASPVARAAAPQDLRLQIAERFMVLDPSKSATLDFSGTGVFDRVVYGRFRGNIDADGPGYQVRNLVYPEQDYDIASGDYGVAILPHDPGEPVIFFGIGELEMFEPLPGPVPEHLVECWTGQPGTSMLFLGREAANGFIYYRNGWRWYQCAD